MAITSLHTISVLGDSPRPVPRQVAEGSQRNQASSVLQMWRKIEDLHAGSLIEQRTKALRQHSDEFNDDISTQTSESNCSEQRAYLEEIEKSIGCSNLSEGQTGMKSGEHDEQEKSPSIGETERERVRQIFQDWMKCGGRGHSPNPPQMSGSSRAQWLGENECERVRVVREWVQLTAQDRSSDSDKKEVTEISAEIEMVRAGLVINQNEGRPNRVHRKIRRLCGKQALLDLLVKAEKERQHELQDLMEHHAVSQFPHRNRIQVGFSSVLLGVAFCLIKRQNIFFVYCHGCIKSVPIVVANYFSFSAFLRFFTLTSDIPSFKSYTSFFWKSLLKGRFLRNNIASEKQKTRSTAAGELGLLRQRQTVSGLRDGFLSRTDSSGQSQLGSTNDHMTSSSDTKETGTKESHIDMKEEITEKLHTHNVPAKEDHNIPDLQSALVDSEEARLATDGSLAVVNEQALKVDEVNRQQLVGDALTVSSPGTVAEEFLQENITNERPQRHGPREGEVADNKIQDVLALSCSLSDLINQGSDICDSSVHMNDTVLSVVGDLNLPRLDSENEQMHEQHSENEDGRMDRVAYDDWRNTLNNGMGNDGPLGSVHGQSLDASENEMVESVLSEGHNAWDESESEESVEDWLQRSSRQESGTFASSDTYGLEDNVRTSELNELIGRRRVSNLLESGFRENLNRLLQNYVERQAQASMGWDLNDSMSSPVSEVLHQEQQTDNLIEHSVETFGPFNHSRGPSPHLRREQIWDQVPWTHTTVHQPLGFDWEVISDLRMDITTLQLRMNDMQKMLEACMEMQLELQRSIRQEVSAALNRSVSPGSVDSDLTDDKSKWELVRKGICCVCSHSNIDSLLYRCGHMCTCTKCANQLFNEKGKCPMCRSPIVEVIRAYSIQQ